MFSPDQKYLVIDYETRSEADLKKVGGYEYSVHKTTQVLCVGWKLGSKDTLLEKESKVWSPAFPSPYGDLIRALCDPSVMLVAHNALFEQLITENVLTRIVHRPELKAIPIERWICTAALAATIAIPRNLEGAAQAMKLPVQKDMDGRRLVLKYCKPRRPTKNNPDKWHKKACDLKRIMDYCRTDIDTTAELFLRLPPLSEKERRVWCLDQKINRRGVRVDRELVSNALQAMSDHTKDVVNRCKELGGFEPTQREVMLGWLKDSGLKIPDLTAGTVKEFLNRDDLKDHQKEMLEIRQAISKSSTAKYEALSNRVGRDGRLRDILLYHGASTGRWSGQGVQLQNLPRGTIKNADLASDVLKTGGAELAKLIYGDVPSVLSSCIRSTLVASHGKKIFAGDYSGIELRELFWMAGNGPGLKSIREGLDLYVDMACDIYRKKLTKENVEERQLGKKAILGCGFQMGKDRFYETCLQDGMKVSKELAERAVKAYREKHWTVPVMWRNLEKASIAAVLNPGKKFSINRTTWFMDGDCLKCRLPSGRILSYPGAHIKMKQMSWGEKKQTLYFFGVHPQTRSWVEQNAFGGLICENVVSGSARDIMAENMVRIHEMGYEILFTVHDEVVAEKKNGDLDEFIQIMSQVPDWASGLPLKVDAWWGDRYKK